ncbi:hypothetical protein Nepgr_027112 [Nepenthes gracilis]|uniref:Uncharacterized protein n=1 Tax=Nepenthes gracilis TaxID=150966 RepID=A0AAD3T9R2_NEPGR|nr:hypothetical protein Nepgr_027112 [Nepenthes gracilis]
MTVGFSSDSQDAPVKQPQVPFLSVENNTYSCTAATAACLSVLRNRTGNSVDPSKGDQYHSSHLTMKDDDSVAFASPKTTAATAAAATTATKKEAADASLFGKGRYKFWALAAMLLLAVWSLFTGTVTLRWSSGNLSLLSGDTDSRLKGDLDVLEMEEREKVVKYMWDVYTNSRQIRLPRFWQKAFEAAYEDLTSDVPAVREAAITEIAKMSIRSIDLDPPSIQLSDARESSLKHSEISGKSRNSERK